MKNHGFLRRLDFHDRAFGQDASLARLIAVKLVVRIDEGRAVPRDITADPSRPKQMGLFDD